MNTEESVKAQVPAPDFGPSELGTKGYWDKVYTREVGNFEEFGDIGEVWFGEDSVDKMITWCSETYLEKLMETRPDQDEDGLKESLVIGDVGCGNGHLLLELAELGFTKLVGLDYSEAAIELATKIALSKGFESQISYAQMDLLNTVNAPSEKFDVVLDKGTFDAISLNPDNETIASEQDKPVRKYLASVHKMLKPDSVILITSCNWTEDELKNWFGGDLFEYHSRIKYPTFTFGGVKGQQISTMAFKKRV